MEKDLHWDKEGKEEIEDEEQAEGVVESAEMKWDETAGCISKKYVERDREKYVGREQEHEKRGENEGKDWVLHPILDKQIDCS